MADPLILDLIDQFPRDPGKDGLLTILVHGVTLSHSGDDHQVDVRPVQTELSGVGAVDLHFTLRDDPVDDLSDLSDE